MKKLILILAIALVASPVFALTITLTREGTSNIIDVNYSGNGATAATRMRAVALDINSPVGTTLTLVSGSFKTGQSTSGSPGYGIYPARINIDSAGVVLGYGSPLADPCDPGAGDGNSTKHIVLEFGSLYYGEANAPAASGRLCKVTFGAGAVSNPTIHMVDEDTYRGGLVFEDGTLGAVSTSLLFTTLAAPGKATNPSPANGATGVAPTGTSLSWTAGTDATSHDVYFGTVSPGTFIGNQVGTSYAILGTMAQSKTYYWRIDEKNSVGTTTGDIWSFNVQECYKSTSTAYAAWVTFGRPSCWCYQRNCRGDADGIKTGLYWVTLPDLTMLQAAYGKNDTALLLVPNGICADFDRTKTGLYRVTLPDLTVLQSYYGKSQTSVPVCDVALVNFWTN